MHDIATLRASAATDAGLKRSVNEDRLLADAQQGVFLIVDGMGGHAAGDIAAQTAVDAIRGSLSAAPDWTETAVRNAIADANNRIFARAQSDLDCAGMACVLTLAVVEADRLTWGHVGDSRLYSLGGGTLRKLTRDHSPVGEREDNGEIDEREAMRHPRRNEVFRDVGSALRHFDEDDFIETGSIVMKADQALLLCSDGLSDQVSSAEILEIIASCGEDLETVAEHLVRAANERGGADNVSVIFVAGPEFGSRNTRDTNYTRHRHSITRVRSAPNRFRRMKAGFWWLLIGIMLGALFATAWVKRAALVEQVSKLTAFPRNQDRK